MTTHTTEQLVDGWLTYQHASDESGIGPENLLWAESEVMDLTYDDPKALWRFIVCTIRGRRSDEVQVREVLAAGPLEHLLTKSGPTISSTGQKWRRGQILGLPSTRRRVAKLDER
jgi:hypothetical protein